jgi:exo-1,4-beta-D-glucosaminidase
VYSHERRTEAVGPCAGGFGELAALPKTTLKTVRTPQGVKVTNTGDKLAFFVRIKAMKDGKLVVPVHYSDNYLNLLPGESKSVIIEDLPPGATLSVKGWNAQ